MERYFSNWLTPLGSRLRGGAGAPRTAIWIGGCAGVTQGLIDGSSIVAARQSRIKGSIPTCRRQGGRLGWTPKSALACGHYTTIFKTNQLLS